MAKFEASSYAQFRVLYPEKLFGGLRPYCGSLASESLRVLDLGSGTGFSAQSFLNFFSKSKFTLVEPDLSMLEHAKNHFNHADHFSFIQTRAEDFDFSQDYDLVLIGSAWHWMDRPLLLQKFEAAKVSAVFIFEYQFPKAKAHDALNEWIRRAFNLKWRTSTQVPRGNLVELTQGFRDSIFFSEQSRVNFVHEEKFDLERFWGMIISQSRFLAFEQSLDSKSRADERSLLREELRALWGSEAERVFILPYEGVFFLRRKI